MDWHSTAIRDLIRRALSEDIGTGDATTLATIHEHATAQARVIAKAPLVCAGLPLVERVFRELDPEMYVEFLVQDGGALQDRHNLLWCRGKARAILTGERTALNFLSHLSGIATLTRRFVEQLAGTRAKIRDTRKTIPGLRALEKYAVRMGGGTNHRFGLYDAILLKENHIAAAGGIQAALDQAHAYASARMNPPQLSAYEATGTSHDDSAGDSLPIQIEVRNAAELREALRCGANAILLDNMNPEAARHAVELARTLRKDCMVEISGGITLENARAYAETGADFLSSGMLTHSAPAADLSLLVDASSATS